MILSEILKDSNYKLTQFSQEQIQSLEQSITKKDDKAGHYTVCLVRKKEIKANT
jgi:type I restriction enzyme M protein